MRSRRLEVLLLAGVLACASAAAGPALTRPQVEDAVRSLRDVPTLVGTKVERELRFKDDQRPPPAPADMPAWLRWLRDFVEWLNDTGRWLVWLLGAFAVAWLLLRLRSWLHAGAAAAGAETLSLPTHVRDLDIRPETLPADIGGAAFSLWQRGEVRAAMALLYRGALSRLVHLHGVPIRASSTEGDCLQLASPRLGSAARDYLERLVAAWRETVYAGREPAAEQGRWLCSAFADRLQADATPP